MSMRSYLVRAFLILLLFSMGCGGLFKPPEKFEFQTIKFHKSGIWMPLCDMVIHNTGITDVRVKQAGEVTDSIIVRISDKEIERLKIVLADAEFFSLREHYEKEGVLDANGHTITAIQAEQEKSVDVYAYQLIEDIPSGLKTLIEKLEEIFESILGREI